MFDEQGHFVETVTISLKRYEDLTAQLALARNKLANIDTWLASVFKVSVDQLRRQAQEIDDHRVHSQIMNYKMTGKME